MSLLSKGLSFCPTPPRLQSVQLENDIECFFRRLRLREYFSNSDEQTHNHDHQQYLFKPPSMWMPPKGKDLVLETYIKAIRTDILKLVTEKYEMKCNDNLTPNERKALKNLRHRDDIVIKPADKGAAVVILSLEDYLKEAKRQLDNPSHYLQLISDPPCPNCEKQNTEYVSQEYN